MKIVFFANGKFALNPLEAIYNSIHNLAAVVTNFPKPAGRKKNLKLTSIAKFSNNNNIDIIYAESLKSKSFINNLKSINADIFIVISFRILPIEVFNIPKIGSINIHASYLPEYPGASPIQYSLMNNEKYLGLTSFFLNDKIDKGDIIKKVKIPIDDKITYGEAHDLLSSMSSNFLLETISDINNTEPLKQKSSTKKYAKKISQDMYKISLDISSEKVHNFFRGLTPPGPYIFFNKKRVKLFDTYFSSNSYGLTDIGMFTIIDNILYIKCKKGTLSSKLIQFEGKNVIKVMDFSNMNFNPNNRFE